MKRNVYQTIITCLIVFFCAPYAYAQSLGDPIVQITFGSGASVYGPALAADSGYTDYVYAGARSPDDGQYGIYNSTAGLNPGWVTTRDHTGDANGYMMVVNASYAPGIFYTRRIDGLCGSTTYQFGAWIKNILIGDGIQPNVTFSVEALDGTLLGQFGTGNIRSNSRWLLYTATFTTTAGGQSVIIKMTNNAPGGGGNDIAIDDITFRPYGTTLTAKFDQTNTDYCTTIPQTIHLQAQTMLDNHFAQRLQRSADYGKTWVNQGAASTQSDFPFITPTTPGFYSYRLVKGDAANIDQAKCVVSSNVLNITVSPPPDVNFGSLDMDCLGDKMKFVDHTTVQNLKITSWHWDFDDNGTTSEEQNPEHLFSTAGIHNVRLTVTTNAGCGNSFVKPIHIYPAIQADFATDVTDCTIKSLMFRQTSTTPESFVMNCRWDFGDGSTIVNSGPSPYPHVYAAAGTYTVTLTITTDKGCTSTKVKQIAVYDAPKPDFALPEVCVSDTYAQFQDKSTVNYNTTLSYLWDFGDDHATAGNPNTSTVKNPRHRYTEAKQYMVSLTVTTAEGCQVATTLPFTVNGANPVAEFSTLNASTLCSNKEVDFVNNSSIDFGSVARVKWDFGDGTPAEVDEDPTSGKLYHHKFPTLGVSKDYTVTLTAYSGTTETSCVNFKPHIITVLASPAVAITAPDSVCLNFGKVQFAAQDANSLTGSGTYSGKGITATGLFDPEIAGVGSFDITYTYTTAGGCGQSVVHTIKVNPLTRIDAGPDVAVPENETTTLHATATPDEGLTYLWTPATGLSSTTIPNPVVKINDDVTYTLTVTNKYGCSVTDQIKVAVIHQIKPPNTFTPNGDGINDTWVIKYLTTFTGCTVDVFNRNGQKVYTSIGYSEKGWDGKYNGADLPAGVYYYLINPKHGQKAVSGYITIIR